MNITSKELFALFSPLILALHEKGVLDISETAHLYEDALARRKLDLGEASSETAFLEQTVQGLHRLAAVVKGRTQPPA